MYRNVFDSLVGDIIGDTVSEGSTDYIANNYEQVIAMIPAYDEHGANITKLYWIDGKVTIKYQKLKTYINEFKALSRYNVDFLMKRQRICFAKKLLLPIPMSKQCFLIPIKARKPIGAGDGAYGYVALDGIEQITAGNTFNNDSAGNSNAVIILKNHSQPVTTNANYVKLLQQIAIVKSIREQVFDYTV